MHRKMVVQQADKAWHNDAKYFVIREGLADPYPYERCHRLWITHDAAQKVADEITSAETKIGREVVGDFLVTGVKMSHYRAILTNALAEIK